MINVNCAYLTTSVFSQQDNFSLDMTQKCVVKPLYFGS